MTPPPTHPATASLHSGKASWTSTPGPPSTGDEFIEAREHADRAETGSPVTNGLTHHNKSLRRPTAPDDDCGNVGAAEGDASPLEPADYYGVIVGRFQWGRGRTPNQRGELSQSQVGATVRGDEQHPVLKPQRPRPNRSCRIGPLRVAGGRAAFRRLADSARWTELSRKAPAPRSHKTAQDHRTRLRRLWKPDQPQNSHQRSMLGWTRSRRQLEWA
jgi:hypothetical protein